MIFDKFIVKDSKTFKPMTPLDGNVFVYVNGSSAPFTKTKEEVTISSAVKRDLVIISNEELLMRGTKDIEVYSNRNAIFNIFGSEKRLKENMRYSLEVIYGEQTEKMEFTSKYNPLYSTARIIQSDLMDLAEELNEDEINFAIWQNSILLKEISSEDPGDKPTFHHKQFVRYKTEIDLVDSVYLGISSKAGSESKKIGTVEIRKEHKIPFLKDMLSELKRKLRPFENAVTGVKVIGKKTRKAGKSPYPRALRRNSF